MKNTHPLKVLKFCPKCGSPDFNIAGERSLKCQSCGFHLYVNASAAVAALVTDGNGRLMMVKRGIEPNYGKLDLPGGFVDHHESVEDAVKRELIEELGMKVISMKYISSAPNEYIFSGFSVFTIDLAFEVIPDSINNLKPMDDIMDYKFYAEGEFNYDDIPAPSIKQFVINFFNR
ncbi:MAG: mutT family [Prolixibacteraceae bacterium]|nr:MAG: mutT family [Prolixibacteraceae bacterium]